MDVLYQEKALLFHCPKFEKRFGKEDKKIDKELFIEKMKDAPSVIDEDNCISIIKNSLCSIPKEQNQNGTLNTIIVMEEFAELQQELSKAVRGKGDRMHLIEELADAYLGIKYVQEIFDISDETLAKAANVKLSRQDKRNQKYK